VYTAAFAYLAEDINATAGDVTQEDCAAGYTAAAGYEVGDPGGSVASCAVTTTDTDGITFLVEVESQPGTEYKFPAN
jgi:hypothetical protein